MLPASHARLFWHPAIDPRVIVVHALPTSKYDREAFNLLAIPALATHLSISSLGEHLLIGRGVRSIHLAIVRGSLLNGPVRLSYQLSGSDRLETRLLALRRLAAFLRLRRLPAVPSSPSAKGGRWMDVIRALDAMALNSNHRSIAEALFGRTLVDRDWYGGSDYLRTRTHRLIHQARKLSAGGYVGLLRR